MKKIYSTPVVSSNSVTRETLSATVNPHVTEPNAQTSLIRGLGFGL
jgi:hypothetical protein